MKRFIGFLSAILLIATIFTLVACDNGGAGASDSGLSGGGSGEIKTERYTFEAKTFCLDDPATGHVLTHVYDSAIFDCPTDVFSKDLALFCISADTANYDEETAVGFFTSARFDNVTPYNYDAEDESYTPACTIAHKKAGESDVVFLSLRSAGYGKGWLGNLDVGREGEFHRGFYLAATDAYNNLKTYLDSGEYKKESLKVVITGHSRGASIADVLGKLIDDDLEYALLSEDNVYVYTFGGSTCAEKSKADATNVFNVILRDDLITLFFPSAYGLYRVGTDIDIFRSDYAAIVKEVYGESVSTFISPLYGNAAQAYTALLTALTAEVDREKYVSLSTRADYVDNLEDAIGKAIMFIYYHTFEEKEAFFACLKGYSSDIVSDIFSDDEALYKAVKASADQVGFSYDDGEMYSVCDQLQKVVVSVLANNPTSAAPALLTIMKNLGYIPTMHGCETIYAVFLNYAKS